jgi:AraC-like DNA-binding protein
MQARSTPFSTMTRPPGSFAPLPRLVLPVSPPIPRTTPERMLVAKERIRAAAEAGQRVRSYEVALDLDLSEFHFARQFRAAFGRSPHVFYDEVRAERARALLLEGLGEGEVARRVGFRRPAELRALLAKRGTTPAASAVEATETALATEVTEVEAQEAIDSSAAAE